MKKKLISIFLALALAICVFPASAFADYTPDIGGMTASNNVVTEDHPLIIERVDVPVAEAVFDQTYSFSAGKQYMMTSANSTRSTNWDVYGTVWYSGTNHFYSQPVGHTAEYDGDTLLDTYHYTRTFFGTVNNNLGDSGRNWGSGVVWAYGSKVPTGNVTNMIQRVYYGTTA